ncbi:MAG: hypothetical protein WAO52_08945 [Prolixibacteraceae bacterium]
MKTNWFNRTFTYLKKVYFRNDKRVAAYLVCVAIATGFWFLNALGKTYTIDLVAPVSYVNFPNNKTLSNKLPDKFELTIKAHGFTLLRQELSFLFMPLEFDVNELTDNRMKENRRNYFAIPSRQFLNELSARLSNDVEILSMNPDTLIFAFDKTSQKRLKVVPNVKLNLKKQYQISGEIKTEPDSILVNGPKSMLDTLQEIKTEGKRYSMVFESIEEKINVAAVNNIYTENPSVLIKVPVEEYTETQQTVPVSVINKPEETNVKLFPAKVKVTFQVGLSRFAGIHPEDFKLTVDFNNILQGKQRLKITTESAPAFIYELKITPEELEYLIEN